MALSTGALAGDIFQDVIQKLAACYASAAGKSRPPSHRRSFTSAAVSSGSPRFAGLSSGASSILLEKFDAALCSYRPTIQDVVRPATSILHSSFLLQLPRPLVSIPFGMQVRNFRTKRSDGHSTGLGRATTPGVLQMALERFRRPQATKRFEQLVGEHSNLEVQDKLKIAFAEGYKIGDGKPSTPGGLERFLRIFSYVVTLWLLFIVIRLISGGGGRSGGGLSFMSSPETFEVNPEDVTISFNDIKGADEAMAELKDIVEFLRNPDQFRQLGAKLPRGVLLVGPPGNGKTLLARAVAGEAGVPFFHASGSQFEEVFVGTGARRVRQLFQAAKERAPCVVFIDEIDSVGAKRTSSEIHPYANQTINQLLAEMDGFETNEGVIVLGATNRRDNLDKALLRPGRFDLEVRVFPPDLKGRVDILKLYLSRVRADPNIDIDLIGRTTTGFSGAELENLVNQAALKAVLEGSDLVNMEHIEFARDKTMMGPEWRNRMPDAESLRRTAYHEAGHTLVSIYCKDSNPIHKVTIIPRGMSLGSTTSVPEKEMLSETKSQLLAELDMCMGGRVAEELIFGMEQVSTGAANDFEKATRIATAMVKNFGMSDKVGPRTIFDSSGPTDAGVALVRVNDMSPSLNEAVDSEIKRLLVESYERAKTTLKTHQRELSILAEQLLKKETLTGDQVKAIIEGAR